MADYKGSQERLVSSDYLYKQFSAFDTRRADKLDQALFITTPEHYEQNDGSDPSALEIIDDSSSVVGSQIKVSDVSPLKDGDLWTPSIGEYAVLVAEKKEEIYLKASTLSKEDEDLDLSTFDDVTP